MSLESEWHAMPEVRDRALRHAAAAFEPEDLLDEIQRLCREQRADDLYFWLGAEPEGFGG